MREILFRGKRTFNDEWIEGGCCYCDNKVYIVISTRYIPDTRDWDEADYYEENPVYKPVFVEVIPETIGQYTGLTDKNGKKIFEGDIVKSCEYDDIYVVKYFADDDYPAFDIIPEIDCDCNGLSHLHIVEGIEVIGNIHDNQIARQSNV